MNHKLESRLLEEISITYTSYVYIHHMQSEACKMLGWMTKLESRLLGDISITSDIQRIPPLWQKAKRN